MDDYSVSQTNEITRIFDEAMDYALISRAETRQEFAWVSFSYVIGALTQGRALWPKTEAKYRQLSDRFRNIPLSERG